MSIHNANAACHDVYVHPNALPIAHPTQIIPQVTKKDISCYGLDNGELTANISGGTPGVGGYAYTWERNINNAWVAMGISGLNINSGEGEFRLKVKDDNHCNATSNVVNVYEPPLLEIETIDVHDIVCFEDKGFIEVSGSGGVAPYQYAYSVDGSTYFAFDKNTPLDAGNYKIRLTDKNGCTASAPSFFSITSPEAALDFSYQLSDYNGFNVSCFGGNNATVTLNAFGGNGSGYKDYAFKIDGMPYQLSPNFDKISAGLHTFQVEDERGCVVLKNVAITQNPQPVTSHLITKEDVVCYGDKTGRISINASGGIAPYSYQLNGTRASAVGNFTELEADRYVITIQDKNNCETIREVTVAAVNPPIEIQTRVTDARCYGEPTGSIETLVTGGVADFEYHWSGLNKTTSSLQELVAGRYTVRVTDQAGCSVEASAEVKQPGEPLKTTLTTLPVCYGKTNGSIIIQPSGGSPPYNFSLGDDRYQSAPTFQLDAGRYEVYTRDANGCTIVSSAEIIRRNDIPEPNFLVATRRNALDTLVIIDISVPKPDSVHWGFDDRATLVDDQELAAQLMFTQAGDYVVSMTGYFGGCDYNIAKFITVNPYDPNAPDERLPGYRPIENATVTPNPTTGEFYVTVRLTKKYPVSLLVYDMIGMVHYAHHWDLVQEIQDHKIRLSDVAAGIYLVRIITETDAKDIRLLVER